MIATEEAQLAHRLLLHVRSAVADGRLPTTDKLMGSLQALLLEHRSSDEPHVAEAAEAIAGAAFGSNHLWEDLGAGGREEVSLLMRTCFTALFEANTSNLRWKRHLFQTLGKRVGQADLRPPKCDGCGDYDLCFGPADPPS